MEKRILPPQLVSLIHHVELNRAGWNDKAVQRMLITAVWMSPKPPTLDQALEFLFSQLHVRIGKARAAHQITALREAGILLPVIGGAIKLSEEALRNFEAELLDSERVEASARTKFAIILTANCPDLDPVLTWTHFNSALLHPMIQEIGANTLGIVSGEREPVEVDRLNFFLQQYPPSCRRALSQSIRTFINPRDREIRQFLLRLLSAHLLVEAISLRRETIESLLTTSNPVFEIYLDTNFVFSALSLHDNPANEAAKALIALVRQLSEHMQARLMVLPTTLDEARRVLQAASNGFGPQPYHPRLAKAALEADLISGISRTFIAAAANSAYPISPEEHFGTYATNLTALLQTLGITVASMDLGEYRADPEVQSDIESQLHFEQAKYYYAAKGRDQLEHDIILWHYVHNHRPLRPESPAAARAWAVSIDYRFLGFDSFKVHSLGDLIPVCLHPTSLIHLLTFWIPRTDEFEEALVSSMQLPFLFAEFDAEAEKVTLRIISTLARFEGTETIPADGIQAILLNEALRQRIATESDQERQVDLIRDAIIEETRKAQENLVAAKTHADTLTAELNRKQDSISELSASLGRAVNELDAERYQRESLAQQLNEVRLVIDQSRNSRERSRFAFIWIAFLLLGLIMVNLLAAWVTRLVVPIAPIKIHSVFSSFTILIWVLLAQVFAGHVQAVRNSFIFRVLSIARWILGTIFLGVLANAIWTFFKS